jgi:catechol 2,3-dioxygenase-like lactoylglutathione lyase family enzyme
MTQCVTNHELAPIAHDMAVRRVRHLPVAQDEGVVGVLSDGDRGEQTEEGLMAEFPAPSEGILLTHFIVSRDVERSRRFYTDVLGGTTILAGEPSFVALANGWIIINVGGGPTDDKPTVTLEAPPDRNRTSSFLNIRVADIEATYAEWKARGAEFLTPPQDRGGEIRCYIHDPDGHLIEVGQTSPAFLEQLA